MLFLKENKDTKYSMYTPRTQRKAGGMTQKILE